MLCADFCPLYKFWVVVYNETIERRINMKRLIVSLLIITALVFSACAETVNDTSSSTPESDVSDVFDMSGINKYPIISNESKIKLPEGVSYSLEIGKDYRERLSQYYGVTDNGKGIACYAWVESGELKFGLKPLADIDTPEGITEALPTATLGEIRAVLNGYTVERRQKMKLFLLDDILVGYENELLYMLGIGENCIEYTVSLGSHRFDIAIGGSEAAELYNLFCDAHANASKVEWGQLNENCEDALTVTVSFAPAGSEELYGLWNDFGSYTLYANGNVCYSPSLLASYMEALRFSEEFYGNVYTRVIDQLAEYGIKYPIAQAEELWCSVKVGLHSNESIVTGDKVLEILALAEELSEKATAADSRNIDSNDYENAIYIEFYKGNMEMESEFTVYSDEYSCLLAESPYADRKYGILPEGSYNKVLDAVKGLLNNGETDSLNEGVEELLTLLDKKGIKVQNPGSVYDVTPERIKNETDYKIFKDMIDCSSYVLVEGEIYQVCTYFGGSGFQNALPCDFDKNGVTDLLVLSSWGSGMHREEISVFNMETKESELLFSTLNEGFLKKYYGWFLEIDAKTEEGGDERFFVYAFKPTPISSQKPESIFIGEIVLKDGKPFFELQIEE